MAPVEKPQRKWSHETNSRSKFSLAWGLEACPRAYRDLVMEKRWRVGSARVGAHDDAAVFVHSESRSIDFIDLVLEDRYRVGADDVRLFVLHHHETPQVATP